MYNENETAIICKVQELISEFAPDMNTPYVRFSNKMTSSGGTAEVKYFTGEMTLTFSNPIMNHPENDFDHYVRQTVHHEVAHLIDYHRNGKMNGHGHEWKKIFTEISEINYGDITRGHHYKVPPKRKRTVKKYNYECSCCKRPMVFTAQRHGRSQRMIREHGVGYTHTPCGGAEVLLIGQVVPVIEQPIQIAAEKPVPKVVATNYDTGETKIFVGSNIWDDINI